MSYSLNVSYKLSSSDQKYYGFALTATVTAATGLPAEIFMFQRGAAPAPAAGEQPRDQFVGVADPVDLEQLPPSAPDLANEIPYYREAEVTLYFRSADERQETLADIKADIAGLIESLTAMDTVSVTETETYGS